MRTYENRNNQIDVLPFDSMLLEFRHEGCYYRVVETIHIIYLQNKIKNQEKLMKLLLLAALNKVELLKTRDFHSLTN